MATAGKMKLEQQMQASEKRFRAMVENGSDAIIIIDQLASPLYLSPGFQLILGYPHNQAITMDMFGLIHPDDIKLVTEKFDECLNNPGKPIRNILSRVKHQQGHWVWTLSTLTNFLSDPAIGGIIDNITDITEEKQLQEKQAKQAAEIQRVKANQEALINGTQDMIWSVSTSLCIVTANNAFLDMMEQAGGHPFAEGDYILIDQYGPESKAKWENYYLRALKGETYSVKEQVYLAEKDRIIYGEVSFNPMYNTKGDIFGIACYAKDITQDTLNILALEKTKSDLNKIMDSSLDMICSVDVDGYFLRVSAASKTILGYEPEEIIGKNIRDFIYPDDITETLTMVNAIMAGNNRTNVENRYIHKDGSVVPLMWSARWDPIEKIRYGIARDATEYKKSEAAIIESEKKYKYLFENNPLPIIIWDFKTLQIVDCNTEAELKYGYTRAEFLQLTIRDIRPPEDMLLLEKVVSTEEQYWQVHKKIWRHKKKNGEIMYMDITGHLIDYNDRRVTLTLLNDITEKIKAEEELKESEEKYRMLFMASPVSKWIYDLDSLQILDVNTAAINHYGYSREEFLSMTIKDIRPAEEIPHLLEAQKKLKANSATIDSGIFTHQKKDKTLIKVNVMGNRFTYRGKGCRMVVCNDVTETWYYHQQDKLEKNILEINAEHDKGLRDVLGSYLLGIEALHPGMLCSIQEKRGNQLFNLASPSLPKAFLKIIEGVDIGMDVGSCGTAALLKQSVIVTDIANDSRWQAYKDIAEKYELKACWSIPILDRKGDVMATFANYYNENKAPASLEQKTIERARHILQVILESYRREKAVKASNQRYKYATKATNDAIWDWDLVAGSLYWGDGFQAIFGYELDKIANDITSWADHIHPNDKDRVIKKIYAVINGTETNWEDEYQFEKADQNYAFVTDSGFVIRDDKGKAIRMVGAMQDITRQKQEELRLRLLESVVTNTTEAVLITEAEPFDEPGPRILYVNEAFTTITGYAAQEVIGKTPRILQGPKSDREELKRLTNAMKKWQPCDITTINYKKNGEEFWINFSVSPVADKNGWYTHWIAIERDVTHQKNEELQKARLTEAVTEALRERNAILESIGDAFFAMDENWIITYWNNMAEKVLGKSRTDVIYHKLWEVYEDSANSLSFAKYKEAMETKQAVHLEDYYAPLGKWYEISAYPSADGLSVYFKDVTDRLNYVKAIEEQNEKFREISWMQSHLVRAPLARIMGLIPMILDDKYDEKDKMLEYIQVSANELDQVIKSITEKTKVQNK